MENIQMGFHSDCVQRNAAAKDCKSDAGRSGERFFFEAQFLPINYQSCC
jgi:hypothetical protein